ncbi:hypothetical protein RvY_11310 [Ramazzottius varieornatus]|uniref:Uncharacterized protein n=1 Tax=Ramazzottius varieornatus TaxID=947166 RepID=A0A1D1VFM7_RAMVA|nr:hypothetical protein RvY_11310 [Ramazzottius varieornatus]
MNEIDKRLKDVETTLKVVDKRTALTQVGMEIVTRLLGLAKKSTPEPLRMVGGSIFEAFGWWKGRKQNIEVEEAQAEDGLVPESVTPDGEDGSGDATTVVAKHEREEVE